MDTPITLLNILNDPKSSHEDRKTAQTALLQIQRDPNNWSHIPVWLNDPSNVQVQFFATQCLIIRINRDWDTLEEENQQILKDLIVSYLGTSTTAIIRNKLEEALVRIMEKAYCSGWWKDPIGDLLSNSNSNSDSSSQTDNSLISKFSILSLIPSLATVIDHTTAAGTTAGTGHSSSSSYRWHHEIKSSSERILNSILHLHTNESNYSVPVPFEQVVNCIKNWTSFGAFTFPQVEKLLPGLFAKLNSSEEGSEDGDVDIDENVLECLIEICELPSKDLADEARKARHFIPICLNNFKPREEEEDINLIIKLVVSITEESSTFLVQNCHDSQVQAFLSLLLKITNSPGIIGVTDVSSQMTLNSWYLLTESIESDLTSQHITILTSLLSSLVRIILLKTQYPPQIQWTSIPLDLKQQFITERKEFLDTLLYLHRALKSNLNAPNTLFDIIYTDLVSVLEASQGVSGGEAEKYFIESRLKALIIITEESDEDNEDNKDANGHGEMSEEWKKMTNLIFSTRLCTETVNAKLAISLIGSLLPIMKNSRESDSAVHMILQQLQSNPVLRSECIQALQQAVDSDVPILQDMNIIRGILEIGVKEGENGDNEDINLSLAKLFTRLVSNISSESDRWTAFNSLISSYSSRSPLLLSTILKAPFNFTSSVEIFTRSSNYYQLLLTNFYDSLTTTTTGSTVSVLEIGECLLAAWNSLAASQHFPRFACAEPSSVIKAFFIGKPGNDLITLGMKLSAAWVYGMISHNPQSCLNVLLFGNMVISDIFVDDAIEAHLDSWIHFIKKDHHSPQIQLQLHESGSLQFLFDWTLKRISIGQCSVPLLRTYTRLLCIFVEKILVQTDDMISIIINCVLSVGISGKTGRTGVEILARLLHDLSLTQPDLFRVHLTAFVDSLPDATVNSADKRMFLRNLGAAHTIKKFKTVLVEFCLQCRGV